jgi:hypothetical protein
MESFITLKKKTTTYGAFALSVVQIHYTLIIGKSQVS